MKENFEKDEDTALMLRFAGGDAPAFELLLEKYEARVINYFYRMVPDRQEAEDLAQDIFLKIYRLRSSYKPRAKFSTLLYRLASNRAIDYTRKNKIIKFEPLDKPAFRGEDKAKEIADASSETPDEFSEKNWKTGIIREAVAGLPPAQRIALALLIYEGKNYGEISEILNCSVSAVESLLFRARQGLKEKLEKYRDSF